MVDAPLVRRKLGHIARYLGELKLVVGRPYEEYVSDPLVHRAAERLIQLLVEVACDINAHVVVDEGKPAPADHYASFIDAAKVGMLPEEFAHQLANAAGERNILVHGYEEIDDRIVHDSLPDAERQFREYAQHVEGFLRARGA